MSVYSNTAKGKSLADVSRHAVQLGDYWTAIVAASSIPSYSDQAENLAFVVRCAIEDGRYDMANTAADKVHSYSERDDLISEVVRARLEAEHQEDPASPVEDRKSMRCMTSP